jgi:hypothetical protein
MTYLFSLIGIFQYEGIPRPYGNCGTQPLKYYNASELYTAAKCNMECDVDFMLQHCDCKLAYMPGEQLNHRRCFNLHCFNVIQENEKKNIV